MNSLLQKSHLRKAKPRMTPREVVPNTNVTYSQDFSYLKSNLSYVST